MCLFMSGLIALFRVMMLATWELRVGDLMEAKLLAREKAFAISHELDRWDRTLLYAQGAQITLFLSGIASIGISRAASLLASVGVVSG